MLRIQTTIISTRIQGLGKIKILIPLWMVNEATTTQRKNLLSNSWPLRRAEGVGIRQHQMLCKPTRGEKRTWVSSLALQMGLEMYHRSQTVLQIWNSPTSTHPVKKATKQWTSTKKKTRKRPIQIKMRERPKVMPMETQDILWKKKQSCSLWSIYFKAATTLQTKRRKHVLRTKRWRWWESRWWTKANKHRMVRPTSLRNTRSLWSTTKTHCFAWRKAWRSETRLYS